jgi:hypothetical protein
MNFFTNSVLSEIQTMQSTLEMPGFVENFRLLTKDYTDGLNQRSI